MTNQQRSRRHAIWRGAGGALFLSIVCIAPAIGGLITQ